MGAPKSEPVGLVRGFEERLRNAILLNAGGYVAKPVWIGDTNRYRRGCAYRFRRRNECDGRVRRH